MAYIPPDVREQCEAGIRAVYAFDPERMDSEIQRFRRICALGDAPKLKKPIWRRLLDRRLRRARRRSPVQWTAG